MPIYEYECTKCGRFEAVQKIGADPLVAKPDCTESKCPRNAQKVISAAAFHLKGSGWYKTDYSSSSSANSPKPAAAKDAKSETKAADTVSAEKVEKKAATPKNNGES